MTQQPRPTGDTPSGPLVSTESDRPAEIGHGYPSGDGRGCVEAGAIDRIRASETPDRDALAEYLLAREWGHDPQLSAAAQADTAHSQHIYHGLCALCRADLPAIVDAIIAAGWRPTTEGEDR